MARQYEMTELSYTAAPPAGPETTADLRAVFTHGEKSLTVRGFYAGNGEYRIRFLPEETGIYRYEVSGLLTDRGEILAEPAEKGRHGPVRARGIHLYHADGTPWVGLGTTVYALIHQEEKLIGQTMATLKEAPFTKVRFCVFPKHYNYNHNEPEHYAFRRNSEEDWDPNHPDFAFWDALDRWLEQLDRMNIQADLILFHPYDRWGFSAMSREQDRTYLDYLLRRLAARPNVWWSLANEYDLCEAKSIADWQEIEEYVAKNDPFRHLLGNHNCFVPWDASRPNITHMSWQTRQVERVPEMQARYGKPVLIDECCYEGDLPETWGDLSGKEMTARFWRTAAAGGYCTHGETFYPDEKEIVWWAKGGTLRGESPKRIAFLKRILEELPGPLYPRAVGLATLTSVPGYKKEPGAEGSGGFFVSALERLDPVELSRYMGHENVFCGACGDPAEPDAILWYLDLNCCSRYRIRLPETAAYRAEVLDTWNMTREAFASGLSGEQEIRLPGREWTAILAIREN